MWAHIKKFTILKSSQNTSALTLRSDVVWPDVESFLPIPKINSMLESGTQKEGTTDTCYIMDEPQKH